MNRREAMKAWIAAVAGWLFAPLSRGWVECPGTYRFGPDEEIEGVLVGSRCSFDLPQPTGIHTQIAAYRDDRNYLYYEADYDRRTIRLGQYVNGVDRWLTPARPLHLNRRPTLMLHWTPGVA